MRTKKKIDLIFVTRRYDTSTISDGSRVRLSGRSPSRLAVPTGARERKKLVHFRSPRREVRVKGRPPVPQSAGSAAERSGVRSARKQTAVAGDLGGKHRRTAHSTSRSS